MSESENFTERILKGLEIPIVETKNLKFRKVKILNCKSVIDDGFENMIGKEFYTVFEFENAVCVEYKGDNITFKLGEYEFVDGLIYSNFKYDIGFLIPKYGEIIDREIVGNNDIRYRVKMNYDDPKSEATQVFTEEVIGYYIEKYNNEKEVK